MVASTYSRVPKGFQENLEFRRSLVEQGTASPAAARAIRRACRDDLLFYVNAFCWTYDPRREPSALPFITWPFQDEALTVLDACLGRQDVLIEKSRDMGASWLCLLVFEWRWHFRDLQSFLLGSRKEELVDKTEDPKSLFWKIDFLLKNQPAWLLPRFARQKLHLHNEDTGSTIDGESTNADFGRGDRRTAILLDEFAAVENGHQILAATADTSPCRVFNSTPKGTSNAFYDQACKPGVRKLRLHWPRHPEKARGLYHDAAGKPRSPWYDAECARRHPMEVAQELDIDYLGSDYQFFDGPQLAQASERDARPPYRVGHLDADADSRQPLGFRDDPAGPLQLWALPDLHDRMPADRDYVIGVDVSAGTGASNSVAAVLDRRTGE
ncbi:MAG TPA: hypothetical protein VEI97_06995, partial [bacterium]|nr:hypothetical protein [bacterium]